MKPFIKFTMIMLVAAGMLGAMSGCAHSFRHKSPQERADWLVNKISDELKLNDAQLSKLNALKDELLTVRSDYRKKRSDTKMAIGEMLSQPTLDQTRALALIKDRTQEVNAKAPQVVSAFAAFYDSLTPEQQKKLHDEVTERMKRHHGYWDDE
jgi:Spy/CpxP family protein refolding chaperone